MIETGYSPAEKLVTIRASGRVTSADYEHVRPELEQAIADSKGALNAIVILDALEGMDAGALWKDLGFGAQHHDDFRRIAVVGASNLEEIAAGTAGLVTGAEVEHFLVDGLDEAREWALAA